MITLLSERLGARSRMARERLGPIGMVLSRDALHLVQVARHRDGLRVRAQASFPYPEGCKGPVVPAKLLRSLMQAAVREGDFQGREVVTTLPPEEVRLLFLNYTVNGGQDEEAALVRALVDRVEGALSDYVVDYLPVRDADHVGGARASLAVLARRAAVIDYLTCLRQAGCEVAALEIGPAAVRRLVVAMRAGNDYSNVLVINFGRAKSYLTVLSGRRLLFDREIAFGEDKVLLRLGSALDMPSQVAEKLVRTHGLVPGRGRHPPGSATEAMDVPRTLVEIMKPSFLECVDAIQQVLLYTSSETRGKPVEQIYLLGSLAHWAGVDRLLQDLIEVPVAVLNPLTAFAASVDEGDRDAEVSPLTAVATGLALRGMVDHA